MSAVEVGLNAVIAAVTDETPRVLTVFRKEKKKDGPAPSFGLPFGPLDPDGDRTLELGLRRWVREQTGIELGYAEQLYTFGDRDRDPGERRGGARVISIAYLTLVRERSPSGRDAQWRDWYRFFPWEDWREGKPALIEGDLVPALRDWQESGDPPLRQRRRDRVDLAFGRGGAAWNWERVLDRYELLYEAGLIAEARRDRRAGARTAQGVAATSADSVFGRPMLLDHRRILATALDRIRGKLRYRPVVFELLPPRFTLFQLQRLVESLAGLRLHKQNFRRLLEKGGLVEGTGKLRQQTRGRPAELFRFRREVLRERPAPGVGLPGVPG